MKKTQKQGTFWVIDGLKIIKKKPYKVKQVVRQLNSALKAPKEPIQVPRAQLPGVVDQRNFFTQKSYQDLVDRRMDYGFIRFSSLDSLRGGELHPLGLAQQALQNLLFSSSQAIIRSSQKVTIFKNQFLRFQFEKIVFSSQEGLDEEDMIS